MEHQAAQHQQYVSIEGIDNSNVVVVKGINVLLTLLQVPIILYQYQYHILYHLCQVVLILLATAAQILKPFLRTPTRVVTTVTIKNILLNTQIILLKVLLITVSVLAIRQWSELKEFSVNFASKVKNNDHLDKTEDL